jgi:protein translocase SEC61 complex gamma subunit
MEENQESKPQENVSHSNKEHKHKTEKPKGPGLFTKLKGKIAQYQRVVSIARKPEKDEFVSSVKITGTGMILIGMIGFVIFLLYFLVRFL